MIYKSISFLLFLLLLISCQAPSNKAQDKTTTTPPDDTSAAPSVSTTEEKPLKSPHYFEWQGTINKNIDIHGFWHIVAKDPATQKALLQGKLIYDKVGKPILLLGELDEKENKISLKEMNQEGLITGTLYGDWKDGNINGHWWSPDGEKEYTLQIQTTPKATDVPSVEPKNIAGNYHFSYGEKKYNSSLAVKALGKDSFLLDITGVTAAPSYHIATIEEMPVNVSKHQCIFTYEVESCKLRIRFYAGFAIIDHVDGLNDCPSFGHQASVVGIYRKVE